jgi:hypothetical protein
MARPIAESFLALSFLQTAYVIFLSYFCGLSEHRVVVSIRACVIVFYLACHKRLVSSHLMPLLSFPHRTA